MNLKLIHIQRLKRLAEHLIVTSDEIIYSDPLPLYFYDYNAYGTVGYEVYFFHWAFRDLPLLFKEWQYEDGKPIYHVGRFQGGMAFWSMRFFGLTNPGMFLHNFSVELQSIELYGGKILSTETDGREIGSQIFEFINQIKKHEK